MRSKEQNLLSSTKLHPSKCKRMITGTVPKHIVFGESSTLVLKREVATDIGRSAYRRNGSYGASICSAVLKSTS